jgi:hypothetical protein
VGRRPPWWSVLTSTCKGVSSVCDERDEQGPIYGVVAASTWRIGRGCATSNDPNGDLDRDLLGTELGQPGMTIWVGTRDGG